MFGKCNHKWLAVDMFGYQHCSKCGLAHNVGKPCRHKWETFESADAKIGNKYVGKMYVLKCSICGDLKEFYSDLIGVTR